MGAGLWAANDRIVEGIVEETIVDIAFATCSGAPRKALVVDRLGSHPG
jgi:hypothetical protein